MQDSRLEDNFFYFVNKITKDNNIISLNSISNLLLKFIYALKESIENSEEKEITWEHPSIKIEYPIETSNNGNEYIFIKEKNNENFIEKAIKKNYLLIFKTITKDIQIVSEKNSYSKKIPDHILDKIKKLPEEEQMKEIDNFLLIEQLVISPLDNKPPLVITFQPMINTKNTKFFTVLVNLDCKGYKPSRWSEKSKSEFWESLINYISKISNSNFDIHQENFFPTPKPLPIEKKNKLIKTSLHSELQKFGKKPKSNQSSIFDLLDPIDDETKKDIIKYQIEVIGIDNTHAQNQALFAIQKILSESGYKGNEEGKKLSNEENSFKFTGFLPSVKFTPHQYLEAYGVSKRKTPRGKLEYNSNERIEAFKVLRELSEKRYLFFYEKKYWKDGKELFDVVKTVRPIFNIIEGYESLNLEERNALKQKDESLDEKLKFIVIEPCPILVDQINSYFVLKPANCYQEIRLLVGKTSKYVPLFIDYLRAEVTKREISAKGKDINWKIDINYETLAYKLRMDKLIKDYKTKKIKEELSKCYKIAQDLGYLSEYETIVSESNNTTIEKLTLNPDKFKRVKEIDEEIIKIESTLDNNLKNKILINQAN